MNKKKQYESLSHLLLEHIIKGYLKKIYLKRQKKFLTLTCHSQFADDD